jgi:hypothetical protein
MLDQLNNQIAALSDAVNSGRKTQREQKKLITGLLKEQEMLNVEKGRRQAILQEYDIQIKGLQRNARLEG